MIRKKLMTILMCTVILGTVTTMGPMSLMADETEMETEAAETEETLEIIPRPEYKAAEHVELGNYKGLQIEIEPVTVTDEDVLAQIRANAGSDILEEVKEGAAKSGDTVNIDYEGKLNGEAFDGGTAKDYDLEIGSGTFIDGFEDGLIGVKAGETVDLPLTFPENYTEELAGKEVVFTVTVNAVKRMPELDSELVSRITDGQYSDVDTYKASIRSELEAAGESSRQSQINSDILTQIASTSSIKDYPQELIDYVVSNMTNYYKQLAESSSMKFADFLQQYMGMTEDDFADQVVLVAQQNLQAEMYLRAIAEAEGIEVSDEEYESKCQEFADNYGYDSVEDFKAAYEESEIRESALEDKVLSFIRENATIREAEPESEVQTGAENEAEVETEAETEQSAAESESETEAE